MLYLNPISKEDIPEEEKIIGKIITDVKDFDNTKDGEYLEGNGIIEYVGYSTIDIRFKSGFSTVTCRNKDGKKFKDDFAAGDIVKFGGTKTNASEYREGKTPLLEVDYFELNTSSLEPISSGRFKITGADILKLGKDVVFEGEGTVHALQVQDLHGEENSEGNKEIIGHETIVGVRCEDGNVFHFIMKGEITNVLEGDQVKFTGRKWGKTELGGNYPVLDSIIKNSIEFSLSEGEEEFDIGSEILSNPPPSGDRKVIDEPLDEMRVSVFQTISKALQIYGSQYAYINEAIQNSVRAEATRMDFEVHDDYLIISDNGIGADKDSLKSVFQPWSSGWKSESATASKPFGEGLLSVFKLFKDIQVLSKEFGFFMDWEKAEQNNEKNPKKEAVIPGEVYGFTQNNETFTKGFKVICRKPVSDKYDDYVYDSKSCEDAIISVGQKWRSFHLKRDSETQDEFDARFPNSGIFVNGKQVQPRSLKSFDLKQPIFVEAKGRNVLLGEISIAKNNQVYANDRKIEILFGQMGQPASPVQYGGVCGFALVKDEWKKDDTLGLSPLRNREGFENDAAYKRFVKTVSKASSELAYDLLGQIQAGLLDDMEYSDFLKTLSVVEDKNFKESIDFGGTIYLRLSEVKRRMTIYQVPVKIAHQAAKYLNKQGRTSGLMKYFREMLNNPESIIDETLKNTIIDFKNGLEIRKAELVKIPDEKEIEKMENDIIATENQISEIDKKISNAKESGVDESEIEKLVETRNNIGEKLDEEKAKKNKADEQTDELEEKVEEYKSERHEKNREMVDFKSVKRNRSYYISIDELSDPEIVKIAENAAYFSYQVLISQFDFQSEVFRMEGIRHIRDFNTTTKRRGSCKPIKGKKLSIAANRLAFLYQSIMNQLGHNIEVKIGVLRFTNITTSEGESIKTSENIDVRGFANSGGFKVYLGVEAAESAYAIFGVLNEFPQDLFQIGPGDVAALLANIEVFAHECAHAIYATGDNTKEHEEKISEIKDEICIFLSKLKRKSYLCKVEKVDNNSIGIISGKKLKEMEISDGDLSIITIEKGASLQVVKPLMSEGLKLESEEQNVEEK
jgi:hypothetical protein